MKSTIKTSLVIFASLVAGASMSYLLLRSPSTTKDARVKSVSTIATRVRGDVREVKEISLVQNDGKTAIHIVTKEMPRPDASSNAMSNTREDDIDEEDLSVEQKQILAELQQALDDDNLHKVRKVLAKLLAKIEKGESVPVCMRRRAVEALGWFGKDAVGDLIPFMADSNEEISSDAFDAEELGLSDSDLSDFDRSKAVMVLMRAVNDTERIDSLLSQLDNMRNSVKAKTISDILANGTDQAKKMMREQLSDYTDSEVTTESEMKKWLAENPDDENDPELYGGSKAQ